MPHNFITNCRMLCHLRIDYLFVPENSNSHCGYTCIQLFLLEKGYMKTYGTKYPKIPPAALKLFVKEVGIPNILLVDHNQSQKPKEVKKLCHRIRSNLQSLEEPTKHDNWENLYSVLKKTCPKRYEGDLFPTCDVVIICRMMRTEIHPKHKNMFQLQGQNNHTRTLGDMGYISTIPPFWVVQTMLFQARGRIISIPERGLGSLHWYMK